MKIAVIGATGFVGTYIVNELVNRGHDVLGVSRTIQIQTNEISFVVQDIFNTDELAMKIKGNEAVVSAYHPGWSNKSGIYDEYLGGANSIQKAVKLSGIGRLIVIGGPGSLYNEDGIQFLDTTEFPSDYKIGAAAERDYLNIIKNEEDLDWAFFSPAIKMHRRVTTRRTGMYRLGTDFLIKDQNGRSAISVEDLAVVIVDEVESPKHHRMRFTAAY